MEPSLTALHCGCVGWRFHGRCNTQGSSAKCNKAFFTSSSSGSSPAGCAKKITPKFLPFNLQVKNSKDLVTSFYTFRIKQIYYQFHSGSNRIQIFKKLYFLPWLSPPAGTSYNTHAHLHLCICKDTVAPFNMRLGLHIHSLEMSIIFKLFPSRTSLSPDSTQCEQNYEPDTNCASSGRALHRWALRAGAAEQKVSWRWTTREAEGEKGRPLRSAEIALQAEWLDSRVTKREKDGW